MKIFVNSLTAFRIVAAFALLPVLEYQWFWFAFVLFSVAGLTDFFDGWLAKKYNAVTKLGGVMDHIGDKLLVLSASFMLAVIINSWYVSIPVVLMIARNIYVSGLREFIGTQKMEMPVPSHRMSWGKVAAFAQQTTLGGILLALCILPLAPESKLLFYFLMAGILGLWFSLLASLISAAQYTILFLGKLKNIK